MNKIYIIATLVLVIISTQSCIKKDTLPPQFVKFAVVSSIPDSTISIRVDGADRFEKLFYNTTTGYLNVAFGFKQFQTFGTAGSAFVSPVTAYTANIVNPTTFFAYRTLINTPSATVAPVFSLANTRYQDTLTTIPAGRDSAGVRIFHGLRGMGALDLDTNFSTTTSIAFSNTGLPSLSNRLYADAGGTATVVNRFTPFKSGTYNFVFRRNSVTTGGQVRVVPLTIDKGKYYTIMLSGDTLNAFTYRPSVVTILKHN